MITPSFALTATERVLPKLALDFTTASLDPRVTFTRTGNTATVVNSSGLVADINADLPRFDYDPITLACKGLLIEEARTNICLYSEDFRNTADAGATRPWTYINTTLDYYPVGVLSPDGTANVCKIVENTATSQHYISQAIVNANANFTFSVFAKDAGRRYLRMMIADVGLTSGSRVYATFDLTNGTSTIGNISATNTAATSQAFGNGWYKCSVTATITAGASVIAALVLSNTSGSSSTVPSYLGDGTSGIYVYGADLQEGLFPTSYIPTEATAVTRNADVATMTGTNFSSWFNASEGAFAYWANVFADNSSVFLQCSKAGSGYAELLSIQRDAGLDRWQLLGYEGGVLRSNLLTITNTFVINQNNKCVHTYKSASYAASANATTVQTSTGNIPSGLDRLAIGHDLVGSGSFMSGYVQKILYYPQRLINAEVQAFSK